MDKYSRGMLDKILKHIDTNSFNLKDNPAYQEGLKFLNDMMNPESEAMQSLEQPYRTQFEQETVPGIAEQFSANDAQRSSAFGQAMGRASSDLEGNIAGARQNAMMSAADQALNYSQAPANMYSNIVNQGLTGPQPHGYKVLGGQPGFFSGAAGGVGGAIGQWGGQGLSNYAQTGRWGGQSATSPQMTMDPAQNNLGG